MDLLPFPVVSPQVLPLPAPVVADDRVGGLQDVAGGAVVLLQADHPGVLILAFKGEDILDGGSPEAVDGLVVVAHHADVLPSPGQQRRQQVLEVVGVLILVDEDVAELPLVILPHVGVALEQADGVKDDVVKVQGPGGPELFLIGQVDVGDLLQAEVPLGPALVGVVPRQEHLVLGPGNVAQQRAGLEGLVIQVQLLQALLDDPEGIVRVVDGEGGGKAQLFNVPPEDAHAGGVEGGRPDVVGVGADGGFQPLLQLPGGLVGEGNGNDLPGHGGLQSAEEPGPALVPVRRIGVLGKAGEEVQVLISDVIGHFPAVGPPAVFQQVGDAVDEHRGFAAARPGQKEQRAFRGQDPFQLAVVEPGKVPGDDLPAQGGKGGLVFLREHSVTKSFYMQWGHFTAKWAD